MILASSNIDTDVLDDRSSSESRSRKLITNAWIAKFEQSYQKAKLTFGNSPDFDDINAIYEKRKFIEDEQRVLESCYLCLQFGSVLCFYC